MKNFKDTPIAIVASNRLDYFTQSINSIYKQAEKREVFCIIDYCGNMKVQNDHIDLLHKKIPHAKVKKTSYNRGCGNNMIDCRRWVFEEGYSQAFILEDDIVVSSTYFEFCENLLKFCLDSYDNIGAVQGSNEKFFKEVDKESSKHIVENTYNHWWGYLITKKCWDTISPDLYFYQENFLKNVYTSRPHGKITKYQKTLYNNETSNTYKNPLKYTCQFDSKIKRQFVTGQDSINAYSFYKNGLSRVCSIVSRAKNIGKRGVHFNQNVYNRMGLGKIIPYEDTDLNIGFSFEKNT